MSITNQMFSKEVDFEMFKTKFWNKNKGRLTISALRAWTEIYSVIKGGVTLKLSQNINKNEFNSRSLFSLANSTNEIVL